MSGPETNRGGPLQGMRVIELGKVWAGPETGKQLAFLGAEVIKIESMGSVDVTRIIGAKSINAAGGFRSVNPQKLSVQINVKDPAGIELLLELLKTADMFLENLRPGAIGRMGLGYDVVKAVNPKIVYVSMGMYGNDGPLAWQTGYAPCFNAIGGLSAMVGWEGRTPTGINVRYADSTYGTVAAYAGLVALIHARRTGVGQFVDVSAVETMNGMIADIVMDYTLNGHTQACDGNKHAEMAPHNVYRCSETDWIAIAVSSDAAWAALADAMGQPGLGQDSRFATLAARKANEEALDRLVSEWTSGKDPTELAADLQARGIAASKSQNSIDLISDAMLWERGLFVDLVECDGDVRPNVGAAFKLSRGATLHDGSPALGQHNDYVLGEILGLSPEEQARLAEAGITHWREIETMKAGSKLKSAVCATEAMVVRAGDGVLECGGKPVQADKPAELGEIDPAFAGGSQIGKRYIDADGTWEILCIKPGKGSLAVSGVALNLKDAKPLPASD